MTVSLAARTIVGIFEAQTGQVLSDDRLWRLDASLGPLLRAHSIGSLETLAKLLDNQRDPALLSALIDALLNNETSFFRDITTFRHILDDVLPRLASARAGERKLRIWSAACSTGQEAYSLALSIASDPERWAGWTIEIIGTDLSRAAISRAREGLYTQFEVQRGLPVRQLLQWFDQEGEQWRIRKEVRDMVRFMPRNLLEAAPALKSFDLVLCRNALLYFPQEGRQAVSVRLAEAIASHGALILGAGETLIGVSDRFVTDPALRGVYRPQGWSGEKMTRCSRAA